MAAGYAQPGFFSPDYCAALDNSNLPIYIIDAKTFELVYCNRSLAKYFPSNPIGRPCYRAMMHRGTPCKDCAALKMIQTGENTRMEVFNEYLGVWGLLHAAPLRWKGRQLIQVSCADINRQKDLEHKLRVREREYGAVVRQSLTGVMRYDLNTDIATSNVDINLERVEEYIIPHYVETVKKSGVIAPASMETAKAMYQDIRQGKPSQGYDLELNLQKGRRWIHVDYLLITSERGGPPHRVVVSFFDNTKQREKELAFQTWNERLDTLLDRYAAYMEVDLTTNTIEAEGRAGNWEMNTGGRALSDFVDLMSSVGIFQDDIYEFRMFFHRERLLGQFHDGSREGELEYRALVDGAPQWYKAELQMVSDPATDHVKASILFSNVDSNVRERERLTWDAERDSMTGLYNHATAERLIQQLLEQRSGERCCFLMIDLDDLRAINSDFGHPEGDRALKGIAKAMEESFGKDDILSRIGGDEFVVLLRDLPHSAGLETTITNFVKALGRVTIGPNCDQPIHVSIGGAVGTVGEEDFQTLYRRADLALFYTKANGKNGFNLYSPKLETLDFNYKPRSTLTLAETGRLAGRDVQRLMNAVSTFFPLVLTANLTRNTYHMMEYKDFTTQQAMDSGDYAQSIEVGASTFHPEDQESFRQAFDRQNLLDAFAQGRRYVAHLGRQLGDDGVYRLAQTVSILSQDQDTGDIYGTSMTHISPLQEESYPPVDPKTI